MAEIKNLTIDDTGNLTLPVGTTNQRPASPDTGYIRFNSESEQIEIWNGNEWESKETFEIG